MTTQTYLKNPISLGKAAKKYGLSQPLLTYWVKKGKIQVLQRPERQGQALLVDEASVVLAMQKTKKFVTMVPGVYPSIYPQPEPPVPQFTTRELIDRFLAAKLMSPKTVRWYQDILNPFAKQYPVYPVEPEPFRKFLTNLPKEFSPRRQLNYWMALRTLSRWCNREYELPDYFSANARKRVERSTSFSTKPTKVRTLTDQELIKLFHAADNFLDKTLIKTFSYTGIRSGELLSITSESILQEHLKVFGKTGENTVPLLPDLRDSLLLLASQVPQGELIFRDQYGKPMNDDGIYQRISKCMKRAGISGKKLGAHTLRHTFGRIMQRESGDLIAVQHLLGHKQISTTKIYADLTDEEVDAKYKKFSPARLFEEES